MRNLLFKIAFWSGIGPALILNQRFKKRYPIFLFHRVSPDYDQFTEPIHPTSFEKIIRLLSVFYSPISLSELLSENIVPSKKACAIVFDDAMKDFYEFSLPILLRYNVPTTLFVPTLPVEKGTTIWNYDLFRVLKSVKLEVFEIEFWDEKFVFNKNQSSFYREVMNFHSLLLKKNTSQVEEVISYIVEKFSVNKSEFAPICDWSMLCELKDKGIEIQAHTHSHTYLSFRNDTEIEQDFFESNRLLSESIGAQPTMIAYPNGGYNDEVIKIASKYYDFGFSVDEKHVDLSKLDDAKYKMIIPRFNVQDSCPEEVIFRIMGFHKLLAKIISK